MNWKNETIEIKKRRLLAKKQGGGKAVDLQHAKGRLTLRERIEMLLDKDSFQEQGEIAGGSETNEKGEIESLTHLVMKYFKVNEIKLVYIFYMIEVSISLIVLLASYVGII